MSTDIGTLEANLRHRIESDRRLAASRISDEDVADLLRKLADEHDPEVDVQ